MAEIWKDIQGYEGYYQVSNMGRVRSVDRVVTQQGRGKAFDGHRKGKILKQREQNSGYYIVQLCKGGKYKAKTVHRIVAEEFLQKDIEKTDVNHKDGDKKNNRADNLEWCSKSENLKHAYDVLKRKTVAKAVRCVETGVVYESAIAASRETNINVGPIKHAASGRYKHAGGYQWERV